MMQFRWVGKVKRAHQGRGLVGTARKGAPLPTRQDMCVVAVDKLELTRFGWLLLRKAFALMLR